MRMRCGNQARFLAGAAIALAFTSATPLAASSVPQRGKGATMTGDPARPARARKWIQTQLFFEVRAPEEWQQFLDDEVTPRFPLGFSVGDLYGQWRSPGEAMPNRARSKQIIIVHPGTAADRQKIAAIRAAWKRITKDYSVLQVTQTVDVSW